MGGSNSDRDVWANIASNSITKSSIKCRYCPKKLEGNSDSEIIVELIYHMYEHAKPPVSKWDVLP